MKTCKLCGIGCISESKHAAHFHKINSKEYYDMFYKKENEGICPTCSKQTKYKNFSAGYYKFCSVECSTGNLDKNKRISETVKSQQCQEETKKTCLEKYGVEYSLQSQHVKDKSKITNLEKYGVEFYTQTNEYIIKTKRTKFEKYGDENYYNKEKIKQTCLERYGVSNALLDKNIQDKVKKYNLEKYGVEFKFQSEEFRNNAMYNGRYKLKQYTTKFNDTIRYQTKPELKYIKKCEKDNIRIINGERIPYILNCVNHVYFCDFKIFENNKWRLVEIKQKHKWFYNELKSGKLRAKTKAAIQFSKQHNYLPYKLIIT